MRIALAQMTVVPGQPQANTDTMLRLTGEARAQGAEVVVFPELAVSGYLIGDTWEQPSFVNECVECGRKIIAAADGITVIFGNVDPDENALNDDGRRRKYNAAFVAADGRVLGVARKTLLPCYREFDDPRYFRANRDRPRPIGLAADGVPLRLGCLVCEDCWSENYESSPLTQLADVDALVNVSSSPFTLGKNGKRHRVFGQWACKLAAPLIYVNAVGVQNCGKTIYTFDGSSAVYNRRGELVVSLPPFAEQLRVVDLDGVDAMPAVRVADDGIATVCDALRYGVRGFLRGIGMGRMVVGVSGGIDSAVAAALYVDVLGADNVLLANLPSRYNSALTRDLAQRLAANLGCRYAVVPIEESVRATVAQVERAGLPVSALTAENIQARDRGSRVLAALAAAFGGGFSCNANKAELTVGYATMYGDGAGALAATADLWKHQVYALARHLNASVYRREVIPQGTIDVVPSAELSAAQDVTQGKGDPLVYPYHDYLLRAFVEPWNRATPEEVLAWYADGTLEERLGCERGLVARLFADAGEFVADLERWWRQYTGIAVAKRIQAPPLIAVSRRAFGGDLRESQLPPHFTPRYAALKASLLAR